MLLIGFLALFLLLIVYLLFVPINLVINTNTNEYFLQLNGLMKASIESDEEKVLKIKLKLFFFNYYFYPLMYNTNNKIKKTEVKKKKKMKLGFKTMLKLLKTFKVKKLLVEIDTGDCILNAKLYPVFGFLNYYIGNFKINFEGRNQMVFQMHNRPFNIIKSFINN